MTEKNHQQMSNIIKSPFYFSLNFMSTNIPFYGYGEHILSHSFTSDRWNFEIQLKGPGEKL